MMLKHVILYTVTLLTICEVKSDVRRERDIDKIIRLLKQQNYDYLQKNSNNVINEGLTFVEVQETDNEDNSYYGSLTSGEIINLIQQAIRDKDKHEQFYTNKNDILYGERYQPMHHRHLAKKNSQFRGKTQPSDYANEADTFDKLLSYFAMQKPRRQDRRLRKTRYQNKASKSFNPNKIINEIDSNFDDYSKVYIILNPFAIQRSKSKDSLTNLMSKILSLSENERGYKQKQHYKGFPVKSDLYARRTRIESRESFGARDSMDESYKQKRSRNDHGGGGSGGRTAIPYVRQRGDIYEKG